MHEVGFYYTDYIDILRIWLVIVRLFTNNAPPVSYCIRPHFSAKRHETKTSVSQKTVHIIDISATEIFPFYFHKIPSHSAQNQEYVRRNTEACSCNYCCSGKAIKYSELMLVVLGIQYVISMRRIVTYGLSGNAKFFHIIS